MDGPRSILYDEEFFVPGSLSCVYLMLGDERDTTWIGFKVPVDCAKPAKFQKAGHLLRANSV